MPEGTEPLTAKAKEDMERAYKLVPSVAAMAQRARDKRFPGLFDLACGKEGAYTAGGSEADALAAGAAATAGAAAARDVPISYLEEPTTGPVRSEPKAYDPPSRIAQVQRARTMYW